MNMFKKAVQFAVAVVVAVSMALPTVMVKADGAGTIAFDVLSINDFHGALIEGSRDAGANKLVKAIKDMKEQNPNTIVVSAGDNFNGTATSNLLYGAPVAAMLKEIDIAMSAVGNHEFDWGLDKFEPWTEQMNAPFVAANIVDKETGEPVTWAEPYRIVEVDGIKVGFIGITTPETAYKSSPKLVSDILFEDPAETAKKWVPLVKEAGADVVILLTHIGTMQDSETGVIKFESLSQGMEDAQPDAIITSHSHQTVCGTVNDIPVVQAYYNGRTIAKLSFVYDKNQNELISVEPSLNEISKTKDTIAEDETMKALTEEYLEKVKPVLEEQLGATPTDLLRNRESLSALGEWTCDVMLGASGADIAVTNAGGLRTDILAGDITMGTMYEVMPFDNVLDLFEMTGAQVKELFEFGMDNIESTNGFIQYSGVTVYFNANGEKGNKITKIVLDNGNEITPDETYIVVTNDFVGTGGDLYTIFTEAKEIAQTEAIRDAMALSVKEAGGLDFTPANRLILVDTPALVEEVAEEATPAPAVDVVVETTETPVLQPATETPVAPVVDVEVTVATPVAESEFITITVEKGDYLVKIAKKHNTTWRVIQQLNNIKNADLIYPNQKLLVPAQ